MKRASLSRGLLRSLLSKNAFHRRPVRRPRSLASALERIEDLECRTLLSATPTLTVADANGTFTGKPFVATVSATVNNSPIPIGQSLNFSTYLGSTNTSRAINVATDSFGNTFVTGWTNGSNFPTTAGAYETTGAADGSQSAFVAKFDPSGNLVWSTLIDGASGFAIAVDSSDDVYVSGHASQIDFKTTAGAYQTAANSGTNAFIAKLNPSGSSVIWATFLGGSAYGEVDGIAVDSADNVYVAGDTTATNFPLKNPVQTQNNGGSDAFITELNSTGSQLVFSTYLGGSGDEYPSAIALDAAGDIFTTGSTDSTDLATTANAIQPAYGGASSDAFVAKLNPSGAGLAYLTYLGGSADVYGSDVEMAVDAAGDAYVIGTTDADTVPMVNAYQSTYSGGQDAFIAELNPSGTAILNSTYFGTNTYASSIAMDSSGNVYIAGETSGGSIPTVDPAYTAGDLYVAELNLSSATLVYSTYLGPTSDNTLITPVGVTSNGNIILTGDTTSESFPTLNATQSSLTGSRDAFVTGLQPELTVSYYAGTTATGTPLPGAQSAVGTYTFVATFTSTDPNYTNAHSAPVTFTISQGPPLTPTVTTIDPSGDYDGSPFTATATALTSNGQPVSGTFAFTYYAGTSVTGPGTSTPPLDAGTYTVVASFTSTDPNYADAQSAPLNFTISPAATATAVTNSAASTVYGQSETLTATVTSPGGTPAAGTVTFYDGATPLGTIGISDGTASFTTIALTAGLHVLTASYTGDGLDFAGSSSVLSAASIIQTIAGTGVAGFNGSGNAATSTELYNPYGIAFDSEGDLFIGDVGNSVVWKVNATTHVMTIVAGTGVEGYNGNNIAATSAELNIPIAVAVDSKGDLFIADDGNSLVREVSASTGLISTIAGTGGFGYNGDGIAATSAELYNPVDVAVDSQGDVFIADFENQRVREISAKTGLISTVAGTGTAGFNGNGIAATSAELNFPAGIALDAAGDLFISDSHSNMVREVSASTGLISTVAGTGDGGYNADGIAATSAELNSPDGLAIDSAGDLFIADSANERVREVSAVTGLISTVAGAGSFGYNGDGIAAGSVDLSSPVGLALDSAGDLFIGDTLNNRVREIASGATSITITQATPTVTFNSAGGTFTGSPLPAEATVAGVVPGVDNTPGSTLEGVPLTLTYYAGPTATGTPLSGAPSTVGTYTVVASFPGSQDYTSASTTDTYSISSASNSQQTPVISVSDPSGTFTGQPFVATISATVNNTPIPIAQSLNFSTYLGSSTTSRAINVTTDDFGNTFVVGWTTGTGFPTTAGAYETTGAADGSRSAFVAKFDPSGNLVWSTLIDGASGFAIAVDGSDNVYVGGDASPTDFQTTTGAYQTTASTNNAFIAKLNPSGSSLIWATYLGGNNFGEVDGIAVDNAGNVYVAGDTTATNFPLKNPIQSQNNGGSDAFVSELNSSGSQLVFSTYGGGSGDDFPSAIALDAAGDIFVTGTTDSTDLPTTPNAIQPTYGGGDSDAFVAKLDPSGAGLAYLTYLGGSGDVTGSDVEMAVDAAGDAYVVGTTDADTIPMVNAYQSTYSGGQDAFIAELNPSGTAILNSTYFGSGTYASGMALDSQGNVYVAGPEFDSIPTVDPASTSGDLYVAEINLSSSTLVYSTTLGATDDNSIITPVGVTSNGNIILAGDTQSESFPTQNAYQSSLTGSRDAFVTGLQPELTVSYYSGTTATGIPLSGAPSAAGTYTVVATFTSTDPNYTDAQSDPVTFTISPAGPVTPTVTAFDSSGVYDGNPFTATATAQGPNGGPASGTFAFTYYDGTSATGTGTSTPPVDAGTYTVVASFASSDPDFTDAQSTPVTFTISPASTATSVSASASTETYGQSETLTATITSAAGTPNGGTVTFFEGTTQLGTAPVTNGTASITTTALAEGLNVVSATYTGDGLDYLGSTSLLTPSSLIETVAGTGEEGSNPGGIPATSANLNYPSGIAIDSAGDIFIAEELNHIVQEVNAKTGLITTVAGTGTAGYNGDGIAATSAELSYPTAVKLDSAGDLFIVDAGNNRIREVNAATGLISTVVGTGVAGYNGDGIAATSAELNSPLDIAFDSAGNLYITDWGNNRVREVNATTGLISTIAGTGTAGYNGDGIAATSAELNEPDGIAIDATGDVFITEVLGERVREIDAATGLISTVAGTGTYGYNGDGIAATSAELAEPEAVILDAAGNLYIADSGNSRIREVDASTGLISTFAGMATDGYNGDGIPADSAELVEPSDIAFDAAGDLFIADLGNERVREVVTGNAVINVSSPAAATPTVTAIDAGGTYDANPFAASATATGAGGVAVSGGFSFTYYVGSTVSGEGTAAPPTNAGTYTVVADFTSTDPNYSNADSAPVTFTISQATPDVAVTGAGGTYNGNPLAASATASGVGGASVNGSFALTYYVGSTVSGDGSATPPTNAGTYTVVAAFTSADPNYTNAASAPVTFTIGQATPTVFLFETGGSYNGNPFPATAYETGIGDATVSGSLAITYYVGSTASGAGSATPPTNLGTYTVVATFTSADPNYSNASSSPLTFIISPAATSAIVSASASTDTFGQSETLTATISSAAGTPNGGSVTFFDGPTPLGTVPESDGTATLSLTTLTAGLHVVTASYTGDGANFAGSSSALGPSSIIETVAGTGSPGYSGDGGAATSAELHDPTSIAFDSAGDLFIADALNNVVREVNATTHIITTVAGTGTAGYNGDGIAATSAELNQPLAIAVDSQGDIFIADSLNQRIREVNASTGLISTIAGNGVKGYTGNNVPAASAEFNIPAGIAVDSHGNLFIADPGNSLVRELNASTGLVSTVAGTTLGSGYNGDGIAATSAELWLPEAVAVDSAGNVFIADTYNNRIREVNAATGLISTVAGTGTAGYNGDGIAATSAELDQPEGVLVDAQEDSFISDTFNQRIREVSAQTGLISTIAGNGELGYYGDGGAAGSAQLRYPQSVAFDSLGNLFIADSADDRIREVTIPAALVTVTPATPTVSVSDAGGVFNGSPFAATATVAGVDNTPGSTLEGVSLTLTYYAGSTATGTPLAGAPSTAGTYTVVASFPGSQDYGSASESTTFSISQASPVISVIDAGGLFNGSPFPATATIAGIVSGVDNTPGSSLEGVPLTLTYYAGTSPTGTPLSGAPTNAGSYTVEASFAGSTDYLSLGRFYSFVIFQAAPVFTVSDAGGTFNGSPFPGTGTVAGVVAGVDNTPGSSLEGVNLTLLYFAGDTLSGTPLSGPPSIAGSYAIEAYFPGSTDYSAGGKGYFFVISQASPVLSVSDPSGTYNDNPFAATATVAGIVSGVDNTPGSSLEGVDLTVAYYAGNNITGTPLSGPPTDAGTYTALASFPGSTDYRPTSDADVFSIAAATPTVTVTDAGGPFTGQPYAASARATGIGGASVSGTFAFTYYVGSTVSGQGSSTAPSSLGTYTVTAAFTSSNPDYSNASGGPVTFTITQPPPTVSAPSAATLYQNGSLTFSTANGNAISVSDSAASGTSDSITLSVTHGVLKFVTTTGLKFTSGSNNSASMTVNGTLANLNADLQTLKYTPTSGYNGPDAINIKAADAGDGLSGTATVNLTVFGPPTLTAPSTDNVNENAALVFSSSNGNTVTLADAAATATSDSLTLTVTHGTLSLGSTAGLTFTAGANNSTTMTVTGTLSSLQAALSGLTYTPTTGYSGAASLTVKVTDSASGFNATATVAITVVVPASQPKVTVSTQIPTSVPGEPVPLVITVSDTNSVANSSSFSLSITFGDGNSAKVTSTNALIVNHVYTKAGTYTVSVTATDEYGHVSTAATTTIHVVAAAVEINPFNPSQTALFVGGTTGKDTVTFTAVSGNQIAVTLNKVSEGTFSTSGPLIVFGQGGADVVTVGAGVTNTSYLLETANADNVETDLDNDAIQWAGLSAAVEILNE